MHTPNLLAVFYRDEHTRNALKEFMILNLEETTIQKVFDKESVEGIAEAKELVEKTFNRLEELYGDKKKPKVETKR